MYPSSERDFATAQFPILCILCYLLPDIILNSLSFSFLSLLSNFRNMKFCRRWLYTVLLCTVLISAFIALCFKMYAKSLRVLEQLCKIVTEGKSLFYLFIPFNNG